MWNYSPETGLASAFEARQKVIYRQCAHPTGIMFGVLSGTLPIAERGTRGGAHIGRNWL
jgi:hypothetical protein